MEEQALTCRNNHPKANKPEQVVLEETVRLEVRALFETLDSLGVVRVTVTFADDTHSCNCEFCGVDAGDLSPETVRLCSREGDQTTFCDDTSGRNPRRCFKGLPFDLDRLTDLMVQLNHDYDHGWMEFDAGRQMVDGGSRMDGAARIDWTCDTRTSAGDIGLWD